MSSQQENTVDNQESAKAVSPVDGPSRTPEGSKAAKEAKTPETKYLSGYLAAWFKVIATGMITLVAFEVIAVNTAMPFIVDRLDGKNLFALAAGISMATQLITTALAGSWVDAKGPKPVIYAGLTGFLGGLLIATFAPNIWFIVLGRAIQGLGGGLLIVPLYVMVGSYVLPHKQPAFFAVFAIAWVIPSLVGPVLAGFLVDYVHWRWVFGVCPLLLVVFFPFVWPKFRQFPPLHESQPFRPAPSLLWGAVCSGILISGLQMISGVKPAHFSPALIAIALVLTVAMFLAARPILPKGIFRAARGVPSTVAMRGLLNGTFVTVDLYLPLLLKEVHGWGPTLAGLSMTASSITWALGSWIQGRIVDPARRRLLVIIAPIIQITGTLVVMLAIVPSFSPWFVLLGWAVAGFGQGLIFPLATVHALALTPPERHGAVSSALNVADTLGAAALVAYGGITFAAASALGAGAFGATIGLMVAIMGLQFWVGTRIFPRETASNYGRFKPTA